MILLSAPYEYSSGLASPPPVATMITPCFIVFVLFGPVFAPSNPYITGQVSGTFYDEEKDEWLSHPLSPCEEYPLGTDQWGNDILSFLLYGARNT